MKFNGDIYLLDNTGTPVLVIYLYLLDNTSNNLKTLLTNVFVDVKCESI